MHKMNIKTKYWTRAMKIYSIFFKSYSTITPLISYLLYKININERTVYCPDEFFKSVHLFTYLQSVNFFLREIFSSYVCSCIEWPTCSMPCLPHSLTDWPSSAYHPLHWPLTLHLILSLETTDATFRTIEIMMPKRL